MKQNRKECFVNGHCCTDCPNFAVQLADEKYGAGIADDMGLKEIKCSECRFNSGECEDCLFQNEETCPEHISVTDKHWEECRQIALYDDQLRKAMALLGKVSQIHYAAIRNSSSEAAALSGELMRQIRQLELEIRASEVKGDAEVH